MARIDGEIVINRPVEAVFDFVADERNEPRYNPRMLRAEKISPGPIGPGTRFRAESSSFRRPVAMIEFTGYERPRRLAFIDTHVRDGCPGKPDLRPCSRRDADAMVMGSSNRAVSSSS